MSVTLILAVVTLVGFALTERNTNQQEEALLQTNTNQAADFASQSLNAVGTLLSSAAATVTSTNGSPSAFTHAEAGLPLTIATLLVKRTGAAYVVTAASGKGFHPGQVLGGAVLSTVQGARSKLTTGPVTFNGKLSTARFALGGSTVPAGLIVYEQFTLNPFTSVSLTSGKPFEHLRITLYGPGPVTTHNLLISTSSSLPLRGPSARASVAVGSSEWTLVAVARHPFIGGFAKSSPLILLILGLFMALIIGIAIEILARRRHYAEALVEERTRELKATQASLVHQERVSAVGEMATVIGHELRNPLGAAINLLFLARSGLASHDVPEVDDYLNRAEKETIRAASLCEDLTAYMRERESVPVPLDLAAVVAEVLESTPPPDGIEVVTGDLGVVVEADRAQLVQILTNVIINAYQAMPDGGSLRLEGNQSHGIVQITVEDSGAGIDPGNAEHLLDPFYTTKVTGSGLGLAIVKRFTESHEGTVSIDNGPGGGARVTIRLPQPTAKATP